MGREWEPGQRAVDRRHPNQPLRLKARQGDFWRATLVVPERVTLVHRDDLRPEPEPGQHEWQQGEPVLIDDEVSLYHGEVVWLGERLLGRIKGRPYWTFSLTSGAKPSHCATEDSLRRPTAEQAASARKREVVADARHNLLDAEMAKLKAEREAKEGSHHDGQAATSSYEAAKARSHDGEAVDYESALRIFRADVAATCKLPPPERAASSKRAGDRFEAAVGRRPSVGEIMLAASDYEVERSRPSPTWSDVFGGMARWANAKEGRKYTWWSRSQGGFCDPLIEIRVTCFGTAHHGKRPCGQVIFRSPVSAEDTMKILDEVADAPFSPTPRVIGGQS